MYNPADALLHRVGANAGLSESTLGLLQDIINKNHQYAQQFETARDILAECGPTEDIAIVLRAQGGSDHKRFALPTCEEVAGLIPGEPVPGETRDIVLRTKEGPLRRLTEFSPSYSPLQYPLLFPFGSDGWNPSMKMKPLPPSRRKKGSKENDKLSLTRHTAFRIHERRNQFSTILHGGPLYQRFLVDMWAACDQDRLNYILTHQDDFRTTLYQGIRDVLDAHDQEDVNMNSLGQRVILPSSYVGGPRHMQQQYQDSLAIARYFQKVDLFITVTANSAWPEIQQAIREHSNSIDRAEAVCRAFKAKLDTILEDIEKNEIFGPCAARVYSIEFQKRGLPHAHILLFLKEPAKLRTPEDIDSIISAELPDPEEDPLLYETVTKCMLHGPCGEQNPRCACMEDGKCSKRYVLRLHLKFPLSERVARFPKNFCEQTRVNHDGYPEYQRRDNGRKHLLRTRNGDFQVDNRWVVPYNPYLSRKYHCHINVECAVSLRSFKYVFKYIHKGTDKASFDLRENVTKSSVTFLVATSLLARQHGKYSTSLLMGLHCQ
jgi:hypothetical protein